MIKSIKLNIRKFVEWKKLTELNIVKKNDMLQKDLDSNCNFIPIYCINLEASLNRRDSFVRQCLENDIANYEMIKAVDGRNINVDTLEECHLLWKDDFLFSDQRDSVDTKKHVPLSNNEIGCALSHIFLYNKIIHEEHRAAVILEDDALVDNWDFESIVSLLPREWDICYLYYDEECIDRRKLCGGNNEIQIHPFLKNVYPALSYIVSANGAKKIMQNAFPLRYPSDGLLGRLVNWRVINGYGIYPRIVRKGNFVSTIR